MSSPQAKRPPITEIRSLQNSLRLHTPGSETNSFFSRENTRSPGSMIWCHSGGSYFLRILFSPSLLLQQCFDHEKPIVYCTKQLGPCLVHINLICFHLGFLSDALVSLKPRIYFEPLVFPERALLLCPCSWLPNARCFGHPTLLLLSFLVVMPHTLNLQNSLVLNTVH